MVFKQYQHINWPLADQAMVSGVNFLTGIILVRSLGLEEYGRYTLIWLSILFFNSIQMAIINTPMMSIGPKQKDSDKNTYYGSVFFFQICFGFIVFLLMIGAIKISNFFFSSWNIQHLALPLATVVFFYQSQDFIRRFFFSNGKYFRAFSNDVISYLGQLFILIFLYLKGTPSIEKVLWVIAGTSACATMIGYLNRGAVSLNLNNLLPTFSRHFHFSKWMIASTLLLWTSGNFFIITAGNLLGATAVGAIKASQNIMAISHILFQGMENFVPRRASIILQNNGYNAMYDYIKKAILYGGSATAGIGVIAICAPKYWLSLLYGAEFVEYSYVLQWLAIIYLLMFLPFPLKAGLRALENTKSIFLSQIIGSVYTITSAYFLIHNYKLKGFLFGMFFLYLLNSIFLFLSLKTIKEI
jgi:O-antigen/teichoic acid export membrane protein